MRSAALLALVSTTVSANTYLCPFEEKGSVSVRGSEHHVHIVDAMPAESEGCIDVTAPEGMEQYLVEAKKENMVESALLLDPEIYNVRQLSSDMFLIQSPPGEAAYTLHTTLFECDFDALGSITTPHQPKKSSLRSSAPTEEQRLNKASFVEAVGASGSEFMSTLRDLTGEGRLSINGRCSYSDDHFIAADYIRDYFADLGYESSLQPFRFSTTNTQNVVGIKYGATNPDEVVVVGGHYDSTSPNCRSQAPGAVDNASGCVSSMMLARAAANLTFDKTVHFMCFGGEEQGLHGSTYYVNTNGTNVIAALTSDMVSYGKLGVLIEGTTNPDIQRLMNLAESNAREYSPDLSIVRSNNSFGSDHVPFQRAGIPAILFIEEDCVSYPCYHRTCDTSQYVDERLSIEISKANAGTFFDVANGGF
jgi:hypothetical protein